MSEEAIDAEVYRQKCAAKDAELARLRGVVEALNPELDYWRRLAVRREADNRALAKDFRDAMLDLADDWDCDSDGHRYNTGCRKCKAKIMIQKWVMWPTLPSPAEAGEKVTPAQEPCEKCGSVYPNRCYSCGEPAKLVCDKCGMHHRCCFPDKTPAAPLVRCWACGRDAEKCAIGSAGSCCSDCDHCPRPSYGQPAAPSDAKAGERPCRCGRPEYPGVIHRADAGCIADPTWKR
jgi:hypothetical protein